MNAAILYLLLIFIAILLIWNISLFYLHKKQSSDTGREYFELNAKLNFLIAVGSLAILLITYLGFDVRDDILEKSETPIAEMVKSKAGEIDSLLDSKNLLKAGIYIVDDLTYEEGRIYRFKELLTIDDKPLPDFSNEPKLIISTATGESLRIEKVTNEYFILGKPLYERSFLALEQKDPKYPEIVKFDVWVADYDLK